MALVSGIEYNRMDAYDFNAIVREHYKLPSDYYDVNDHADEEFLVLENLDGALDDYELERLQQFRDVELQCTPTRTINGMIHDGKLQPGNYIIEMGY